MKVCRKGHDEVAYCDTFCPACVGIDTERDAKNTELAGRDNTIADLRDRIAELSPTPKTVTRWRVAGMGYHRDHVSEADSSLAFDYLKAMFGSVFTRNEVEVPAVDE